MRCEEPCLHHISKNMTYPLVEINVRLFNNNNKKNKNKNNEDNDDDNNNINKKYSGDKENITDRG